MASCIFCRIIKKEIPSIKLLETESVYAFLDIQPLSKGHALVIPKEHAERFHELKDESLLEILSSAKKIVKAMGIKDYNLLQNNGAIAHQAVNHVHFHIIPKPSKEEGLQIGWPQQEIDKEELNSYGESIRQKL